MKIYVPKISGFCYGVSLAVKSAEEVLGNQGKLIMYGEIVHNPIVTKSLAEKGGIVVESIDDIPDEMIKDEVPVMIRAHGISKSDNDKLINKGALIIDKTCPKVKKVHDIVRDAEGRGKNIIVIGDERHPEVIGIVGQCKKSAVIIKSEDEARALMLPENPAVVSQTTFNLELFGKIAGILKNKNPGIEINSTICPATEQRQKKISELSKNMSLVIVIGGRKSSNSRKLYDIASEFTNAMMIENLDEIEREKIGGHDSVMVCGGSSTPFELIESAAKIIKGDSSENEIIYL